MANSLSTITNNIYNVYTLHAHGDCQAVQIGTSNALNESSNQIDVDEDELNSEIEDLRFRISRRSEDIDDMKTHLNDLASKLKTKDEEIAELKDRVADLEAFRKKVEQSEVTTNTNTNTRRFKGYTSNAITLNFVYGWGYRDTITISKKDSVNDLIKLIEEKKNRKIGLIVIYRYIDGLKIRIYNSLCKNNKKNDYSLEQLGVVDQDEVVIFTIGGCEMQ